MPELVIIVESCHRGYMSDYVVPLRRLFAPVDIRDSGRHVRMFLSYTIISSKPNCTFRPLKGAFSAALEAVNLVYSFGPSLLL